MAIINRSNCKEETDYEWSQLIALTGVKGLNIKILDKDVKVKKIKTNICIVIENDAVTIIRYFARAKKEIKNLHLELKQTRCGSASKILQSQVHYAKKHKYRILKCTAYRNDNREPKCMGYLIWGKLGYLMDTKGLEKFNRFIDNENIKADNLNHLLTKVENGENQWIEKGFSWNGRFLLEENSPSELILKTYIEVRDRQS